MTDKTMTYATPLQEGAALNGGEYVLVMQGGNPVWVLASAIGGGGGGAAQPLVPTVRSVATSTTMLEDDRGNIVDVSDAGGTNKTFGLPVDRAVGDGCQIEFSPVGEPSGSTLTIQGVSTPDNATAFIGDSGTVFASSVALPVGGVALLRKVSEAAFGGTTYHLWTIIATGGAGGTTQTAYSDSGIVESPSFETVAGNTPTGANFAWTRNGSAVQDGHSAQGDVIRYSGRITLVTALGDTPHVEMLLPTVMLSGETTHVIATAAFDGAVAQVLTITPIYVGDDAAIRFLGTGNVIAEATITIDFIATYQADGPAA